MIHKSAQLLGIILKESPLPSEPTVTDRREVISRILCDVKFFINHFSIFNSEAPLCAEVGGGFIFSLLLFFIIFAQVM